eukprot:6196142-Pleurochrysis_carterae.AAC.2
MSCARAHSSSVVRMHEYLETESGTDEEQEAKRRDYRRVYLHSLLNSLAAHFTAEHFLMGQSTNTIGTFVGQTHCNKRSLRIALWSLQIAPAVREKVKVEY